MYFAHESFTGLDRVSMLSFIWGGRSIELNWNAPDNVKSNSQLLCYEVSIRDDNTNETIAESCVTGTTTSFPLLGKCVCEQEQYYCSQNITVAIVPWSNVTEGIESSALVKGIQIQHEINVSKCKTFYF